MVENPVIGVTGGFFKKDDYVKGAYAHQDYVTSLTEAGAVPIILPSASEDGVGKYMEFCDGFVISGGCDVDPRFYNENPSVQIGAFDTERDRAELQLIRRAAALNKPVFGICRGLQAINVAFGGSLIQDIPSEVKGALQHEQKEPREKSSHLVKLDQESGLYQLFHKQSEIYVNSLHHQAIKRLADDLRAVAYSDDGIIEAVEAVNGLDVLGIQWHPESMAAGGDELMRLLFKKFVRKCRSKVATNV